MERSGGRGEGAAPPHEQPGVPCPGDSLAGQAVSRALSGSPAESSPESSQSTPRGILSTSGGFMQSEPSAGAGSSMSRVPTRAGLSPLSASPVLLEIPYGYTAQQPFIGTAGMIARHEHFFHAVSGIRHELRTPVLAPFSMQNISSIDAAGRIWLPYIQTMCSGAGSTASMGYFVDPRRYYRIVSRRERRFLQWMRIRGRETSVQQSFHDMHVMSHAMFVQRNTSLCAGRRRRRHESRRAHALRRRRDNSGRFLSGPATRPHSTVSQQSHSTASMEPRTGTESVEKNDQASFHGES